MMLYTLDTDTRRYRKAAPHEIAEGARAIAPTFYAQGDSADSPAFMRRTFHLMFTGEQQEVFAAMFLDSRHRVIATERLFRGTFNGASVYPREVAKRCLHHNAGAIVVAHNHPSGIAEPSAADRGITARLKEALMLIDVRLLDHFVCGHEDTVSFAERGWL